MNETPANPRLEAALSYARRGWHVFPCLTGLKAPATEHGFQDATTDEGRIRGWWAENPNYNVAIATGPSNLCVIDVDPAGHEHWNGLLADIPGLADASIAAPRISTPRAGFHVYLEGEGPSTVSKLAKGIDTRGANGYVLAPPSVVSDGKSNGEYAGDLSWVDPVPVPPALAERFAAFKPAEREAPSLPPEEIRWDSPDALSRAEAWLTGLAASGDVAVEGCGGDQRTYEVACKVLEMGITPDTTHRLMMEFWNPECQPPWDSLELQSKIHNAWRYGQETKGGKAEKPIEEQHKHLLEEDPIEVAAAELDLARFTPVLLWEARKHLKPPEWIVPGIVPRRGTGILFGASGTLKTFALLDLALSVATGHGPNWWDTGDREPQPVLFLAGEGPHSFKGERVDAWLARHPMPGLQTRSQPYVLDEVPPFELHNYWTHMVDYMKSINVKPALVVIDTLSRAMLGLDENSARDATKATGKLEWLSRQLGSFVIAVHHTGKMIDRGMRGSYAWYGNVDAVYEASRESKQSPFIDIHVRKMKDGRESEHPMRFESAPFGPSLALTRIWNYEATELPEPPRAESGAGTEEWLEPNVLVRVLRKGALNTDQLAESISQEFALSKRKVKKALYEARRKRYRAWTPEGDIWRLPMDHPAFAEGAEF